MISSPISYPLKNMTMDFYASHIEKGVSLKANFRQRVNLNKAIHITKSLIGKGKIFVSKNDEIKPHDILGKSILSPGFSVINLANKLGTTGDEAQKYLQRSIGKTIYKGELLAYKKGLLNKKFVTAPTDGLLEFYDPKTGQLRIQFLSKEIPLTAGVVGIVDNVNYETGEVIIRTLVDEIYGVFGSGKERSGTLDILGSSGDLLQPSQIKESMKQHIIVSGALIYGEALRKAAGFGLYGVISGGLNASDYKAIINSIDPKSKIGSDVGFSLIATEGFGPIPIGDEIYTLLRKYQGRFVIIHGNTNRLLLPSSSSDSILSLRKIALPFFRTPAVAPELDVRLLKLGSKVRVIWPPFLGAIGIVSAIDKTITKLDSGVSTYLLTVETPFRKIRLPYTNIELTS